MQKVQIKIPNNNIEERSYIVKCFFSQFIPIPYEISVMEEQDDYILSWKDKEIRIVDHFFSIHKVDFSYLDKKNIPEELMWFDPCLGNRDKIPMIFGQNIMNIESNYIECGLDIFASSFFMLTRWEEVAIDEKDEFNTFLENKMFAVKHGINDRAIVNEYVELMLTMMLHLDKSLILDDTRKFEVKITHDIDLLFRYDSFFSFLKNLSGDILLRKNIKMFFGSCKNYLLYMKGKVHDPFDTFDEYMNLSDSYNFKSSFFFIPYFKEEKDATYDIRDHRIKKIIDNIVEKGHEVGFHPSMNTFHNEVQFADEFQRLKKIAGCDIIGGRHHYLLYDIKETLRYWANNKDLKYDSGLGFNYNIGFRCGCCYDFTAFDIVKRAELNIIEKPLIVMDGPLFRLNLEPDEILVRVKKLIDVVSYYNGTFVLLWHNDSISRPERMVYNKLYVSILDYLSKKTA